MHKLDIGARAAEVERHPQCVKDEGGAHVAGELPADDHPAVDVDHEREEDAALPAAQVGEVRTPELIRAVRCEVVGTQGSGLPRSARSASISG